MTEQDNQQPDARAYPTARRRRTLFGRLIVWLVPLGVLAVCGYLGDKNLLRVGPEIDIAFNGPAQVETEKTPVRYKGVEIGRVKAVSLSPDLQKVIVHVRLEKFAEPFATAGSVFWIVRPQITSSGIEGIETLTQGSYLTALPGKGEKQENFQGLSDDPDHAMDSHALKVVLFADHIEKLKVGSLVQYRGVPIGEVSAIELDKSGEFVRIALFIRGPYRDLINSSTHFEYAGGFQAAFDMKSGLKLKIPGFQTLLSGSINVVTANRTASPLDVQALQRLYPPSPPGEDQDKKAENSFKLILTAKKIVKLKEGSEVRYRGMPVGQVDSIALSKGEDDIRIRISIAPQYASLVNSSSRFWYSNGIQTNFSLFGGASVQVAGLPVLLNGAIDFVTLDKDARAFTEKPDWPII